LRAGAPVVVAHEPLPLGPGQVAAGELAGFASHEDERRSQKIRLLSKLLVTYVLSPFRKVAPTALSV
jgi:hypothetical protein